MTTPNLLERVLTAARRRHVRGTDRAIRLLRGNNLTYPIRVRTRHGVVMLADPVDWGDRFVIERGFYELEVFEAIRAHLEPTDTFWDIGANSGLHALTVQRLFPAAGVVCFEPSPFTYARLVRNAQLNGADRATLLNVALSDRDGYAPLDLCLVGHTGTTRLAADALPADRSHRVSMPCRIETAERVVDAGLAPEPNVVKIDVEGHEENVLRGFGRLLEAPTLRAVVFEGEAAVDSLRRAGFEVEELAKHRPGENTTPNFVARRP